MKVWSLILNILHLNFHWTCFPKNVRALIRDIAASKASPVDYIGASLLAVVAGMIGNARKAKVWDEWEETPILWMMLMGDPSSGKSPALQALNDPVVQYEKILAEQYKSELKIYNEKKELADIHHRHWKRQQKSAVVNNEEIPQKPEAAEFPNKPKRPRVLLVDTTIEEAGAILSENDRGLILIRDELSGFIKNFNAYSSSQDREFYLQAYNGSPYSVDRVKLDDPIIINCLGVSILGTIQPEKFNDLLEGVADDGFMARFLYVYPNPVLFKKPMKKPQKELLEEIIIKLRGLSFPVDRKGGHKPIAVPFSSVAENHFLDWCDGIIKKEQDADGVLKSHIGKMRGMVVRVSLILCYIDWALSKSKSEPKEISAIYVKNAIRLIDGYFLAMAHRALAEALLPREQRDARTLAKWILREEPDILNVRAFIRMKGSPLRESPRLKAAIQFLCESDWLHYTGGRDGNNAGRQRQEYAINPKVFEYFK